MSLLFVSTVCTVRSDIQNGKFDGPTTAPWKVGAPAGAAPGGLRPRLVNGKARIGADQNGNAGQNRAYLQQEFDCGDSGASDSCGVYFTANVAVPAGANEKAYVQLEHPGGVARIRAEIPPGQDDYFFSLPGCGTTTVRFYVESANGAGIRSTLEVSDVSSDCSELRFLLRTQLLPASGSAPSLGGPTVPLASAVAVRETPDDRLQRRRGSVLLLGSGFSQPLSPLGEQNLTVTYQTGSEAIVTLPDGVAAAMRFANSQIRIPLIERGVTFRLQPTVDPTSWRVTLVDPRQLQFPDFELEGHRFRMQRVEVLQSAFRLNLAGSASAVAGEATLRLTWEIDGIVLPLVQDLQLTGTFDPTTGAWDQLAMGGWCNFPQHAGISRGDHAPWTPGSWQPKLRRWNRDANGNGIEDVIEQMPPSASIPVILDLNAWPCLDDLEFFGALGTVTHVIGAPTLVTLDNVRVDRVGVLASHPRVAMVEYDHELREALDVSVAALRVTSSTASPGRSVADQYPQITGAGVNLAVIDGGVDNGVHQSLPAGRFIAGADLVSGLNVDPDDNSGHGTAVAAAALGSGVPAPRMRGVAPGAGLIDLKISGASQSRRTSSAIAALHTCRTNRTAWGVGVVLFALASDAASDGQDAASQTVNDLVGNDIVVVTALGNATGTQTNHFSLVGEFAAADSALAVAGSDDHGTPDRALASLYQRSRSGPRLDGARKPDVVAPAVEINTAVFNTDTNFVPLTGTSMAAAQVAGVAALIRQASRPMSAADVRQLILDTAEDKGVTGWDPFWGYGLVDAFAAIDRVLGTSQTGTPIAMTNVPPFVQLPTNFPAQGVWPAAGRTDLGFQHHTGVPNPSVDLYPVDPNVREDVPNVVIARVTNFGASSAVNFRVEIGVYPHSNGDKGYVITNVVVAGPLPPGARLDIQAAWTPSISGAPPGVVHSCLYSRILFPQDTSFSNNEAQHNVDIQQTHSPARSRVLVLNPTGFELLVGFEVLEAAAIEESHWSFQTSAEQFIMGAGDCPQQVEMVLTPGDGATPRARATVRVLGQRVDRPEAPPLDLGEFAFEAYNPGDHTAPSARADVIAFSALQGAYFVDAPGVLRNDVADSDSPRAMLVASPAHGQLTLQANGAFLYVPEAGFAGSDTFTYQVVDGVARSEPVDVILHALTPPRLHLQRTAEGFELSWAAPRGSHLVLSADVLAPNLPAIWRPAEEPIAFALGENTMALQPDTPARFFKLLALGTWNCQAEDWNTNGIPDHFYYDWNGDGTNDIAHIDANEDGYREERWEDTNHDGRWDTYFWDDHPADGKHRWDRRRYDRDHDGQFEEEWQDTNGNGKQEPNEVHPLIPPVPVPLGPPLRPAGGG